MSPLGWRKENYRHSLAARGIKTNYYAQKRVDLLKGGLADMAQPSQFNPAQLRKGVIVEAEHTDDPAIAREIAMDHLMEDPKYYDHLAEMEKEHRFFAFKKDKGLLSAYKMEDAEENYRNQEGYSDYAGTDGSGTQLSGGK